MVVSHAFVIFREIDEWTIISKCLDAFLRLLAWNSRQTSNNFHLQNSTLGYRRETVRSVIVLVLATNLLLIREPLNFKLVSVSVWILYRKNPRVSDRTLVAKFKVNGLFYVGLVRNHSFYVHEFNKWIFPLSNWYVVSLNVSKLWFLYE